MAFFKDNVTLNKMWLLSQFCLGEKVILYQPGGNNPQLFALQVNAEFYRKITNILSVL